MEVKESRQALNHLRVLDLTDEKGVYCAKVLADLGADTIKIEPPGGHPTRQIGPFVDDVPHPERSLHWFHYNTNKRSITLDLRQAEGKSIFKRLVKTADIVVESFKPGYLASLGLGYEDLKAVNPRIVLTSLTGFGQTGPYANFETSDLVAWATSGFMYTCGYPWTAPMRPWGSQSYHTVSHYGVIGSLAAIYNRRFTGEGQHVDISMQEAIAAISEHSNMYYVHDKVVHRRRPNEHTHGPGSFRRYRTKDGWIELTTSPGPRWDALVLWMKEDRMAEWLDDPRWQDKNFHKDHIREVYDIIERWTLTKTKDELFHESQKRHLPNGSVKTIAEVVVDPQLMARDFWVKVEHPELGRTLTYPGAPYQLKESPWAIRRRAPLIGEHNEEVYLGELGFSREDLVILKEVGVV